MSFTRSLLACVAACALLSAAPAFTSAAWAGDKSGVDQTSFDKSVAPGSDFWTYANGEWIKAHPIPADRSSYGKSAVMVEEAAKRTVDLIQAAAQNKGMGAGGAGDGQKVGDYYASYMDEATIEAKGITPLKADLARIAAIKDRKALAAVLGGNVRADVDALNSTDFYTDNVLGLWVSPAFDDTSQYAPFLLQGGLGMPDRQYYVGGDATMQEARAKYVAHVAKILTLGASPTPRPRRPGSSPWRLGSPRPRAAAPTAPTSRRPTTAGPRPISRPRPRAWTGKPSSRPRAWPTSRASSSGIRPWSWAWARSPTRRAWTPGRTT